MEPLIISVMLIVDTVSVRNTLLVIIVIHVLKDTLVFQPVKVQIKIGNIIFNINLNIYQNFQTVSVMFLDLKVLLVILMENVLAHPTIKETNVMSVHLNISMLMNFAMVRCSPQLNNLNALYVNEYCNFQHVNVIQWVH